MGQRYSRGRKPRPCGEHGRRSACVLTIVLSVALAAPAVAFNPDRHEAITREALPFLRATVLTKVAEGNSSQDSGIFDKADATHHFDNCEFSGTTGYIRSQYKSAMDWLRADDHPRPLSSAYELGRLLHPLQDFYSHSNWVEWGRRDLLDDTFGMFPSLKPWSAIRDDLIVGEGESVPNGWKIPRMIRFLPRVQLPSGSVRRVVVTGATFTRFVDVADDACHDEMTDLHNNVNKDDPGAWHYRDARALAVRQTAFEWCRTLQRARTTFRSAGIGALMGLWVSENASPHPRGTPCAPRRGTSHWRVRVSEILVKNTLDADAEAGEINLTLALVDDALHGSRRSQIGPLAITANRRVPRNRLPEPLEICATAGTPPIASVQGWDDDAGLRGQLDIDSSGDTDDVLDGATLANARAGTHVVSSDDLRVTFKLERLAAPNDPQPCVGRAP